MLQAALDHGIHIQHFCWHPDLSVDGNCRTCMIEVEKMPKLQIACNTVITEGMVVHTNSPKAREAQRTALEFLLHQPPHRLPGLRPGRRVLPPGQLHALRPLRLQGGAGGQGQRTSGFRFQKVVDLGPIMLDSERCVLCSRCIRFEKEVTGTNLMEFR